MTDAPKIFSALAAVTLDLTKDGIGKDRLNEQQRYKFRGIDDIYNALAPLLAKHGVVIIPTVLKREVLERATQKGGLMFSCTLEVRWSLICAEDGSMIEAVTYGEAMDSGDKATNKAMSAAYKYLALLVFCIPTEASPETDADFSTHEVAPRKPATDPAIEIRAGIARGDASGAASYLAGLSPQALDAIWVKLTEAEQAVLTDAWPKD